MNLTHIVNAHLTSTLPFCAAITQTQTTPSIML